MNIRYLGLVAAFSATGLAKLSTSVTPSLGILSLITPTVNPSDVSDSVAYSLSSDAVEFYGSYLFADSFNLVSALLAFETTYLRANPASTSIVTSLTNVIKYVPDAEASLLDQPTDYLNSVKSSIAFLPSSLQSSILSQVTGILSGYMSVATEDVLSKTAASGPITPGMSIDVGMVMATGSASSPSQAGGKESSSTAKSSPSQASGGGSGAAAASSSKSKAWAAPAATPDLTLLAAAAGAAAGICGVILL